MNARILRIVPCIALALVLAGCGPPSKEDLLAKAKDARTRTQLEKALGKADDVSKLGPVEKWTYKAKNGQVVFVLVGETVTIEAAGGGEKKN
jgi:hypothetical protein